jgi:Farnesoic acid 0-methyl transferase
VGQITNQCRNFQVLYYFNYRMETTSRLKTPATNGKPAYLKNPPVWLPTASRAAASLRIKVKAASDAHILLSCEGERKAIEIVVGGWKNTRSEIRRGAQGMPVASVMHDHACPPLDKTKFCEILVSWTVEAAGVSVRVAVAGQKLEVLERSKKIPVIKAVYVSTGFGHEGEWQVIKEAGEAAGDEREDLDEGPVQASENQTPFTNRSVRAFKSGPVSEPSTPVGAAPVPLNSSLTRQTPLTSLLKRKPQKASVPASPKKSSAPPTPIPKLPRDPEEHRRMDKSIFAVLNQFD